MAGPGRANEDKSTHVVKYGEAGLFRLRNNVIGGSTPMNLYSIRQYPDTDAAYIRQ
jgi:hypothetical protein